MIARRASSSSAADVQDDVRSVETIVQAAAARLGVGDDATPVVEAMHAQGVRWAWQLEFAEDWNARATAWFVVDQYGLSIADIQQTLIREPRHFGALAGLGMILERMNRPKAALQAYQEAGKVHPNRPNVKAALARLEDKVRGIQL